MKREREKVALHSFLKLISYPCCVEPSAGSWLTLLPSPCGCFVTVDGFMRAYRKNFPLVFDQEWLFFSCVTNCFNLWEHWASWSWACFFPLCPGILTIQNLEFVSPISTQRRMTSPSFLLFFLSLYYRHSDFLTWFYSNFITVYYRTIEVLYILFGDNGI